MKQLLMILLILFATQLSAQTWVPNDSSSVGKRGKYTNTTTIDGHAPYKLDITPVIDVDKQYQTMVAGTFTATTAADTLSGSSVACKGVVITNNTAGAVLYVISSGSGTTSTGTPLYYLGSLFIPVTNLNKVYLISDTASNNVRYIYYQ